MTLKEQLAAQAERSRRRLEPAKQQQVERMILDLAAADVAAGALGVGEMAPDFALPSAGGGRIRLADRLGRAGIVLVFYRGTWCPFCDLQLRALSSVLPAFRSNGADLLAISPAQAETEDERRLGFPLLTDYGNRLARLFGLVWRMPPEVVELYKARGLDLPAVNGTDGWDLPLAASYVLRPDGIVHAARIDHDFRRRPEPDTLLAQARDAALVR